MPEETKQPAEPSPGGAAHAPPARRSSASSPPPGGKAFEVVMDVRWGDMDVLGHVNNATYLRYFEEARVHLLSAIGLEMTASPPRFCVLAHASCDFLKPLMYPARIVVGMTCVRIGRSSLELDCWIARAEDRRSIHARGRHVMVCADGGTGKSVPWTPADRAALQRCFSV